MAENGRQGAMAMRLARLWTQAGLQGVIFVVAGVDVGKGHLLAADTGVGATLDVLPGRYRAVCFSGGLHRRPVWEADR